MSQIPLPNTLSLIVYSYYLDAEAVSNATIDTNLFKYLLPYLDPKSLPDFFQRFCVDGRLDLVELIPAKDQKITFKLILEVIRSGQLDVLGIMLGRSDFQPGEGEKHSLIHNAVSTTTENRVSILQLVLARFLPKAAAPHLVFDANSIYFKLLSEYFDIYTVAVQHADLATLKILLEHFNTTRHRIRLYGLWHLAVSSSKQEIMDFLLTWDPPTSDPPQADWCHQVA